MVGLLLENMAAANVASSSVSNYTAAVSAPRPLPFYAAAPSLPFRSSYAAVVSFRGIPLVLTKRLQSSPSSSCRTQEGENDYHPHPLIFLRKTTVTTTSLHPGSSRIRSSARAQSRFQDSGEVRRGSLHVVRSAGNNGAAARSPSVVYEEKKINGAVVGRSNRTAVVWFKRDLRVDDHPGLAAAATYANVLPLYVFDPELLAGWSTELVGALRDAVLDLRKSLQKIDSDLVIKFGKTKDVLEAIANESDALDIIAEEEVEMDWYQVVQAVSTSLSEESEAGKSISVKQWRSSLYDIEGVKDLPDCYKTFQRRKYPIASPLDPPSHLPSLPRNVGTGTVPSIEEVTSAIASTKGSNQEWEDLTAAQRTPAEVLLRAERSASTSAALESAVAIEGKAIVSVPKESGETGYVLNGGSSGALNMLKGYLSFLEPTGRDDWQELSDHVWSLEKRPGASFRGLFGNALALGTLSLRRVYQEAMEYEKARGGGWLSPFGFSSFTASAAVRDSKAIEWYQLLALKSREQGREQGFQVGTWRWRGFLIQYALAGEAGPPVLFVHGFGAFWQHWRDNINSVAESGHRVFALTMLGFGRSEKPMITYTDLVWGELIRDFIIEVIREPVIAAGNSIGGYTVSVAAGLWPSLVRSLILLNSAGRVVPDYKSLAYNRPREKSSVAYIGSRLLLAYLQNLSNGMLTKCYPTHPTRADNWLQGEVMRASYDPNSTAVLEAMFHLRAPLPLNYYLDRYGGDILIIQGMRDPLHNSSKRASMLQAYCKNVSIQYVNAGHCPHDEVPEDVNSILTTWLRERKPLQSTVETEKLEELLSGEEENKGLVPDVLIHVKQEIEELV